MEALDPATLGDLERILDENTAGDPMSALKWTSKSTPTLAEEMRRVGHPMNADTVSGLKIRARLDTSKYEKGVQCSEQKMSGLQAQRHEVHPQWNYTISP